MTEWYGCYGESWKSIIVDDAFSHPAKFSRGLIRRIYEHAIAEGWLAAGDTVIDPFGGVALGARDAITRGINWHGVELEEKFVKLGRQNIALWNRRSLGVELGEARLVQGDSRRLSKVLCNADAAISSPPYADADAHPSLGSVNKDDWGNEGRDIAGRRGKNGRYGTNNAQLGNMRNAGYEAAISSPPFEKSLHANLSKQILQQHGANMGRSCKTDEHYGTTNGQLGTEAGSDFWAAARRIVDKTYAVLRPGAHAIWVTKAFVRDGERVDFPGQWRRLCEAAGFVTVCEHRAWLVEDRGKQYDLFGELHEQSVARKSFFRRLAEKNGAPSIDYEVVMCMRKPS